MLAKVDGIHEFTGLREFADMPLKYYSSGMYMRLAFAIATEVDPDILLIDEALGVGDAAFLDKAKARLHDLSRPLQGRDPGLARYEVAPRAVHPRPLDPARPARGRRPDRRGHRRVPRPDHRAGRLGLNVLPRQSMARAGGLHPPCGPPSISRNPPDFPDILLMGLALVRYNVLQYINHEAVRSTERPVPGPVGRTRLTGGAPG